jgi:hypothetical protein
MSGVDADQVDISNPDLKSSFKELTDEKSATNWVAFTFNGDNSALELLERGEGGWAELKKKMVMNWASRIIFGGFIVYGYDHRSSAVSSKRQKLVVFTYVGNSVPELQRAKTSFQKNKLLSALFPASHLTLEIQGRNVNDYNELSIAKQLYNAGAAHKPTHYSFTGADNKEVSVEQFAGKEDQDSDDEFRD